MLKRSKQQSVNNTHCRLLLNRQNYFDITTAKRCSRLTAHSKEPQGAERRQRALLLRFKCRDCFDNRQRKDAVDLVLCYVLYLDISP